MNKDKTPQGDPLMEKVDYTDFIAKFVQEKLALLDVAATDELQMYIVQDVEDYLLTVRKSVQDLTPHELFHITDFIKGRVEGRKGL